MVSVEKTYTYKYTTDFTNFLNSIVTGILEDPSATVVKQTESEIHIQKEKKIDTIIQKFAKLKSNTITIIEIVKIHKESKKFLITTDFSIQQFHINVGTLYKIHENSLLATTKVNIHNIVSALLQKMSSMYILKNIKLCRKQEQKQLKKVCIRTK